MPKTRTKAMMIVCPNCSTSDMVDSASLGPGGRTVRCARCKSTWFENLQKPEPNVNAVVQGAITEAEAESGTAPAEQPPPEAAWAGVNDFDPEAGVAAQAEAPPPAMTAEAAPPEAVTLEEAPSLVPPLERTPDERDERDGKPGNSGDTESYAANACRRAASRHAARRSSRWTAAVLMLFAINVALIGARNDLVRYLPQTAPLFAAIGLPVNPRHLSFENAKISKERQDGINILW